ncbi:MAG: sulfur carrier protein ThiS, partial [Bryobacteraceae bacterium]
KLIPDEQPKNSYNYRKNTYRGNGNGVQSELIRIWINGEPKSVAPNQSVSALLDFLQIASDRVAVELNKSIVHSRDWKRTTIPSGSHVEVVEFVGGG